MTQESVARIVAVAIVAGHDARAEVELKIRYPSGGISQIRLDQEAAQHVLDQAGIQSLDELRGQSWDILRPALGAPEPAANVNTAARKDSVARGEPHA